MNLIAELAREVLVPKSGPNYYYWHMEMSEEPRQQDDSIDLQKYCIEAILGHLIGEQAVNRLAREIVCRSPGT